MTNEEKLQKTIEHGNVMIKELQNDLRRAEHRNDLRYTLIDEERKKQARILAPLIEYIIGTTAFKETVIDEVKAVLDEQLEHTAFKHEDY